MERFGINLKSNLTLLILKYLYYDVSFEKERMELVNSHGVQECMKYQEVQELNHRDILELLAFTLQVSEEKLL